MVTNLVNRSNPNLFLIFGLAPVASIAEQGVASGLMEGVEDLVGGVGAFFFLRPGAIDLVITR